MSLLNNVYIKVCKKANQEHKQSKRAYAHTWHFKNTICIADAIYNLPKHHVYGLLLHEMGHLLLPEKHREMDANIIIFNVTGIPIKYKDSEYGKYLQYIDKNYYNKAYKFLSQYIVEI